MIRGTPFLDAVKSDLKDLRRRIGLKKMLIGSIPYTVVFYVADKLHWLFRYCAGRDLIARMVVLLSNIGMAFDPVWPSLEPVDLLYGVGGAVIMRVVVWYRVSNAKHFRQGIEYGSARWGTAKDIKPFVDPVYENNIILTATEMLTLNGRPKNPIFARNKNVIIIGGSGSGKTRYYVKPQLMQMPDRVSFVVTDPKASLVIECGTMLVRGGYKVKIFKKIHAL